jgi:hypothetical protein
VLAHGAVAPLQGFPQLALREADVVLTLAGGVRFGSDILAEFTQQPPRLRRQAVPRFAHHLSCQTIGQFQIIEGGDHIFLRFALGGAHDLLALVLMQQRAGGDQHQVLGMVPAIADLVRTKRKLLSPRDQHLTWLEQALRVLVTDDDPCGAVCCLLVLIRGALPAVNRSCLLRVFIGRDQQAAVG